MRADRAALYVLTLDGRYLQPAAIEGADSQTLWRRRLQPGERLTGRAVAAGKPLLLRASGGEGGSRLGPADDPLAAQGAQALLSAPLKARGEILGALTLALDKGSFHEGEKERLAEAGALIALMALDAARERNLARREDRRLRRALWGLPFGVLVFDERTIVEMATPSALGLLDCRDKTVPGCPVEELFPKSFHHELRGMLRQTLEFGLMCERQLDVPVSLAPRPSAPSWRRLSCLMAPLPDDGGPKGGAAILQALSREETVRRAEPTAAFISMISHELRTPLTSIKGAAHLLLTADPDDTIGSQRAIAGIVRKNADRLVNLINDLIDLARVENDSLSIDPAPESLEEIVEEALRMVEPLATSRQATATVERDPSGGVRAMADYELALQATRHLIENAIKFGPMGGQVAISIKRENDWAVLTVSDRGEGIPESFRPLLFEKFTQGESEVMTRRAGGSGLGLFLVRTIAERHGGAVELVSSSPEEGSVFRMTLPAAPQAPS